MKLIATLFTIFTSLNLLSQTVIKTNELLGKWKIIKIEIQDQMTLDVEKNKVTLSPSMEAQLKKNPEGALATENLFKEMLQTIKKSYMIFEKNGVLKSGGVSAVTKSKYTFFEEKQKLSITGNTAAGKINNAQLNYKDKVLVVEQQSEKSNKKATVMLYLKK